MTKKWVVIPKEVWDAFIEEARHAGDVIFETATFESSWFKEEVDQFEKKIQVLDDEEFGPRRICGNSSGQVG